MIHLEIFLSCICFLMLYTMTNAEIISSNLLSLTVSQDVQSSINANLTVGGDENTYSNTHMQCQGLTLAPGTPVV